MDPALFIRHNTAIVAPPLVPEVRLHLATEVTPIWQATEETLAQGAVPPPYWAFAWAGGQAIEVVTTDLSDGDKRFWKLVTAGDICYEQPMAERAMRWLRRLAGRGSMVLLGDPGRAHVPGIGLCELARYEVPTSQDLEGRERCDGFVWRVLAR